MDNEQTPDTIYLRDGNEFPLRVLDLVPSMILRTDIHGIITYCNAFVIEKTGIARDNIIGKWWGDIIIHEEYPDTLHSMQLNNAVTLPAEMKHEMLFINGETYTVQWDVTVLKGMDGAVTGAVLTSISIEVKDNEYRRIFKSINDILQNLDTATLLDDSEGRIIDSDNFMRNLFDVDRQTSIGYTVSEISSNEYSIREMKDIFNGITSNKYRVLELEARHPSTGKIYNVKILFYEIRFQGRDFILGIVRDILFNKIAAEELRESESKFRTMFQDAAIPQLIIEDGRFIDSNKKAREMIGANSNREIEGLSPVDISPEFQPDGVRSSEKVELMIARAMEEGPSEFEWVHRRINGEELHSIVMLTPIVIRGKTVLHTIWTDITERKRAEAALRQSERKYRSIFEGTSEAIMLIIDKDYFDCNKSTLEMFGFNNKEDFLFIHPSDISPRTQPNGKDSNEEARAHLQKAYQNGIEKFEWTHCRANGEPFPAEVVLSPFELNGTRVLHATVRDISERKKAEESLRESEARNRLLADIGFEGILIHDNGIAHEVNTSFCTMHGYAREELIGRDVIDLLIADECKQAGYEKTANENTEPYELISRKKDGTMMQLELIGKILIYHGKRMRVTALRDITERKRMEDILRQSESRFRTIFESANESIVIRDAVTGAFIEANRKALDMYGYDNLEELKADDVWMDPPYSFADVLKHVHKADEEGPQNFEWCLRSKNGALYWLDVRLATILIDGKKICLSMFHDITTRKTAEEALRESEEKFRRITESSLDVILTTDQHRVIRFISPSISRYTGFRPDELCGRELDSLIPGKDLHGMIWRIHAAMEGKAVGLFETTLFRKDGTHAVMEFSIVPVPDKSRAVELEFYARDISEKSQLEHEVIRMSELERQRIGQDLHDGLGQALTGISIMIGSIARKIQLGKAVRHSEIMLIAKRVEDSIEITRRTARGLIPVTMESGGLLSALREMASVIKSHYRIECSVKHKGLWLDDDIYTSTQLFFIATEAVNNAIKHSNVKNIGISITFSEKTLTMIIDNDGTAKQREPKSGNGMGLKIMEYRARLIDASIHSGRGKNGYRVRLEKILP